MDSTVKVIGLDIAKNVFVAVGKNAQGKVVLKHKMSRAEVLPTFANLQPTKIGIEACAGSHYWARKLKALGHEVQLIAAQHTRAYVSGNKNDTNDAAAIAEACSRESMKTVPINTETQQDMQMLHRSREALKKERNAMIYRIRAFAGEYGQVFALGVAKFHEGFSAWLDKPDHGLSGLALETFQELKAQLEDKEKRMETYDKRLVQLAKDDVRAQKLMQIPGVGNITATAILAAVSDPHHFKTGRDLAANLGLTPREHSSGGKQRLGGITKRGDRYVRTLLVHCARSALRCAADKPNQMLRWALAISERRGLKIAVVALANKMARIIWALLAHDRAYAPVWLKKSSKQPA